MIHPQNPSQSFKIRSYNQISVKGLNRFSRERYEVGSEISSPHAIILRSHNLLDETLPDGVTAIARAGAGVNNVPVSQCSAAGIVVFNTPGANANAVKELVLTGLLLSCRGVTEGINFIGQLGTTVPPKELAKQMEAKKKQFKGSELAGKTLGIVGLGAIGSMLADMALALGMNVVGYDPAISIEAAWRLSSRIKKMDNLSSLMARSDFISLHVPSIEATRKMVNGENLSQAKPGAVLLNFSRSEIVDNEAVISALNEGRLSKYVSDFPIPELIGRDDVIFTPHIGASTAEAEDNCAVMAADQLVDFLENGNIKNSVNFPNLTMERSGGPRITFCNHNVPGVLGHVLSILADKNVNVTDMLNKSRDDIAYNIIDVESEPTEALLASIYEVEHVIKVRVV
ncbi:phosphoglycerate dehydrogenase [Alkalimarinus coralli]|uniref:phosphoglycerate dehydrogenase n=1 Tax=Alkalimarinus coralli TaxID=2935863 RepID=UPI00202B9264|nr:phosphoglycerate dehydrogenase [Alkalimarinus coralli]